VLLSACSPGIWPAVVPVAPQTAAAPAAPGPVPEEEHRLSFTLPPGWVELDDPEQVSPALGENGLQDARVLVGPATSAGNPFMTTATARTTESLDDMMSGIWRGFPGAEETGRREPVEVAGRPALRATGTGTVNGTDVAVVAVVIDDGPLLHVVTVGAAASIADATTTTFEGFLESVRLTPR
jgi:hypothetical protein